jgi:hypothetical protein
MHYFSFSLVWYVSSKAINYQLQFGLAESKLAAISS